MFSCFFFHRVGAWKSRRQKMGRCSVQSWWAVVTRLCLNSHMNDEAEGFGITSSWCFYFLPPCVSASVQSYTPWSWLIFLISSLVSPTPSPPCLVSSRYWSCSIKSWSGSTVKKFCSFCLYTYFSGVSSAMPLSVMVVTCKEYICSNNLRWFFE